jgi:DNA-binding response OmpR family regulator
MAQTVLIADDEPKLARLVAGYLEAAGYRTLRAADGKQAVEQFHANHPDLVILDVMMPVMDGLAAARAMLREADVPIIFLTARTEETERVVGLELGADDYVTKPFSPRELVARVRAVLRRGGRSGAGSALIPAASTDADAAGVLARGVLRVDPVRRSVTVSGEHRELTSVQFDLLVILATEPGRVWSREQLLARLHGREVEGYERTIDAHIKNLRRALGDSSDSSRFIGTVRGVGYRFVDQEDRA